MEARLVLNVSLVGAFFAAAVAGSAPLRAGEVEGNITLRVEVSSGVRGGEGGGVAAWSLEVASRPDDLVPVDVEVVLESRLEPCLSEPSRCAGGEDFYDPVNEVYGCTDMVDNDQNGLRDILDPDCYAGVSGYSFSVETAPCFGVWRATTRGTVGDLETRPPGLRDVDGGNFHLVEVADPARNGGRQGVVVAVVFSFIHPTDLDPVRDSVVLRFSGRMDGRGLEPGESTEPCILRIVEPSERELSLRGPGEPVFTAISVHGHTFHPAIVNATVALAVPLPGTAAFVRGDADGDGLRNITDGISILRFLFRGGAATTCLDAADADDSGGLAVTDAIRLFNFLFLGSAPLPGPAACGLDATDDGIDCDAFAACP